MSRETALCRLASVTNAAPRMLAILPCLQETPKFLADTKYVNPADVLHSPFQIAHKTDLPAFVWAVSRPDLMADFNLWMSRTPRRPEDLARCV